MVVLNRSDYTEGILNIINDTHKCKDLYSDPTIIREGKLQSFLRDLIKNGKIDKEIYSTIYPSGSQPAHIYGLPKMHKIQSPNAVPPFRPIVSSVNTFNYHLAKYLFSLLQPQLPNTYSVCDTFSFVQELESVDLCTGKNSHIFNNLKNPTSCKDVCRESCFKVLDTANTYHNLRIKEALHITWERPNLNKQLHHYNVSLIS